MMSGKKCQVAEWLAQPTSDHEVPVLNPIGGRIQLMTLQHFIITLPSSQYHLDLHCVYYLTVIPLIYNNGYVQSQRGKSPLQKLSGERHSNR